MIRASSHRPRFFSLYMHMRLMPCNRPYGIVWSYPDLGKKEVSAMILSQIAPYISGYFPSITPNSLFLGEDALDNNSSSVRRKGDTMHDFFFRNDLYIGSIKKKSSYKIAR